MAKKNLEMMGKWAFLIGLLVVVIAGIIEEAEIYTIPQLTLILVVLGLIVGFLNIAEKNVVKLLVAILVLISVGTITVAEIPVIDAYLGAILANILLFAGAAGLVVAIKAIYEVSKK